MYQAQILVGDEDSIGDFLPENEFLEGLDILYVRAESLGIDEVRELKYQSVQRPLERKMRNFFVCAQTITIQAQNAFLKLLEDPPETVRFYLVLPSIDFLLDTVLSRVQVVVRDVNHKQTGDLAQEFLSSNYAERIKVVDKKIKEKDKKWFTLLLNNLETISIKNKEIKNILSEIFFIRKYQKINGSSQKMLFEHLAVSLPTIR